MSRQQRFLPVPGEALPDWRQIAEAAKRMGFGDAFDYEAPPASVTAEAWVEPDARRVPTA